MKRLIRTSALLTILMALLTLGLVAPVSGAPTTGAVKGVITLDGKPVPGLKIELHWTGNDSYDNDVLATDTTDSNGAYSFTFDVFPDDEDRFGHTIVIRDPQYRVVATSRRFRDQPGKTVTRSAWVKEAATITGSVKRGDGRTTQRLRVDVVGPDDDLDPNGDEFSYDTVVRPASNGSFTLRGLPSGPYSLAFVDEGKTYFRQCYDNVVTDEYCSNDDVGTPIRVSAGQTKTVNPQVLSTKGRRISGTITDTAGNPITHATILTVEENGPHSNLGRLNSNKFMLGPLRDGRYSLRVYAGQWEPQWFDGKQSQSSSTLLDVTGRDVSGIQIRLRSTAKIKAALAPGKGTVKVAVDITRRPTVIKASGTATIRWGEVTKTVHLVEGKAVGTLKDLPKGRRQITVSYAGSASTAPVTAMFYATVR